MRAAGEPDDRPRHRRSRAYFEVSEKVHIQPSTGAPPANAEQTGCTWASAATKSAEAPDVGCDWRHCAAVSTPARCLRRSPVDGAVCQIRELGTPAFRPRAGPPASRVRPFNNIPPPELELAQNDLAPASPGPAARHVARELQAIRRGAPAAEHPERLGAPRPGGRPSCRRGAPRTRPAAAGFRAGPPLSRATDCRCGITAGADRGLISTRCAVLARGGGARQLVAGVGALVARRIASLRSLLTSSRVCLARCGRAGRREL